MLLLHLKSVEEELRGIKERNSLHCPGILDTEKDYGRIIPICHADFVSGIKRGVLALN